MMIEPCRLAQSLIIQRNDRLGGGVLKCDKAGKGAGQPPDAKTSVAVVYLYLNAEGWIRFGPYQWLLFSDDGKSIMDQDGQVVAGRVGDTWTVEAGEFTDWQFRTPFISASPRHPRPHCG